MYARYQALAWIFAALAFALAGWKVAQRQPPALLAGTDLNAPGATRMAAGPPPAHKGSGKDLPLQSADTKTQEPFAFDTQFASSTPGQSVHAASMVELRGGGIRAVWFSGSREGARDVRIRTSVLDPHSLLWGPESTVLDRNMLQRSMLRYVKKLGNPVIARAPDGSLYLWLVNVSLGGWAGSAISWTRSTDEGASWSPSRRLVTSPFLNISTLVKGAPYLQQNGYMGLPVYHEFITKFSEIVQLDPQGRVAGKTRIPGSQTSLQPVVLVTDSQHAQAFMRSGKAQMLNVSKTDDAGQTWSTAVASAWPNPDSAVAAVNSRDGSQWLALNPLPRGRESLALLQSRGGQGFDASRPWMVESVLGEAGRTTVPEYERLLRSELGTQGINAADTQAYVDAAKRQLCDTEHCSREFSYPFLLQSRDGFIHLLYTWHRSRIKHVRFDPRKLPGSLEFSDAAAVH